jgi:hypothetical protein
MSMRITVSSTNSAFWAKFAESNVGVPTDPTDEQPANTFSIWRGDGEVHASHKLVMTSDDAIDADASSRVVADAIASSTRTGAETAAAEGASADVAAPADSDSPAAADAPSANAVVTADVPDAALVATPATASAAEAAEEPTVMAPSDEAAEPAAEAAAEAATASVAEQPADGERAPASVADAADDAAGGSAAARSGDDGDAQVASQAAREVDAPSSTAKAPASGGSCGGGAMRFKRVDTAANLPTRRGAGWLHGPAAAVTIGGGESATVSLGVLVLGASALSVTYAGAGDVTIAGVHGADGTTELRVDVVNGGADAVTIEPHSAFTLEQAADAAADGSATRGGRDAVATDAPMSAVAAAE